MVWVLISFKTSHFFPSVQNRIFGYLLIFTIIDLSLDVITAITIENALKLPFLLNYFLNTLFYSVQSLFPVIVLFYAIAISGKLWALSLKRIFIAISPALVSLILLILVNPFTSIIFYLDPVDGYVHASYFYLLHLISGTYLVIIVVYLLFHRKVFQKKQISVGMWLVLFVIISMAVQVAFPYILIIGPMIGISVIVMYFMLQNPRDMVDYRTKTLNYNAFVNYLNEMIMEKELLNLISIELYDLTYIKRIFGINNANMLINEIATFLKDNSKNTWVFRTSDTRFVVIASNKPQYEELKKKISENFNRPFEIGSIQIIPSVAICCVTNLKCADYNLDDLVSLMESAISDTVKYPQENNMHLINECDMSGFSYTLAIESALHTALKQGEGFMIYFQPIYSTSHNRFVGIEALVRFIHPEFGLLLPAAFLPIVERNGHMQRLDQIVVSKVCEFIEEYKPFTDLNMEFLCINLSASEFASNKMPEKLTTLLKENMRAPEKIFFEVTETVAASSRENLVKCMKQYIEMGYRFALDDFGTGYANVSQVIEQPFSLIKIDQSLLSTSKAVLDNIIHMIASLDKLILIEGVEEKEQFQMLKDLEVDYVQGYYLAKPMRIEDLTAFLKHYNYSDL